MNTYRVDLFSVFLIATHFAIMKITILFAFATLALTAHASWFGRSNDHHHHHLNETLDASNVEIHHGETTTLTPREHMQTGPDHETIHQEIPIKTKYIEIPMIQTKTAIVTATVTATETATATETTVATQIQTVTDTKVQTVHAVETILPTVDKYRLGPGEVPRTIADSDHLVHRSCVCTDITVPKTARTAHGIVVRDVKNSATGLKVATGAGIAALTGAAMMF